MTKKEIVKAISDEMGLTQLQIKEIVQRTFDAIVETLIEEGRVELRNFGVFQIKTRAARKARNPRTGHQVEVPKKFVVTFKPGKVMENRAKGIDVNKAATWNYEIEDELTDDELEPNQQDGQEAK